MFAVKVEQLAALDTFRDDAEGSVMSAEKASELNGLA
jgi:hypothetical protein